MIAKISPKRGRNPIGLVCYLFGPGRHNEHTGQHMVAADDTLGVVDGQRYTTAENRAEVVGLGHDLNAPFTLNGTEFTGGHIWHTSLSLPAGEKLTDEQWAEVARGAVDAMGFSAQASGKAPCRWLAVRHGLSAGGNDHIHLVVDLIREDGTKASIWNDRRTMSRYAAEVEQRFGLTTVEGRAGAGTPGLSRAELEKQVRTGAEPDRLRLARAVRAAAVASADEAEFVRRLRATPAVLVRPRYAVGGREEVVGYSVAIRPAKGAKAIWYGGGRLASDLTLARLREAWPDQPESRTAAVAVWRGRASEPGREARVLRAEAWAEAAAQVDAANEQLLQIPLDDYATWTGAAREMAGVFAALSMRSDMPNRVELARASDSLVRSGLPRHWRPRAQRTSPAVRAYRGVQMVALQAGPVGGTWEGEAMLIAAMMRTVREIQRSHMLRGEAEASARLAAIAEDRLVQARTLRGDARTSSSRTSPPRSSQPPTRPPRPDSNRGFDR